MIASLDHLVLTVASIERTLEFYTRVLGMTVERFGEGRVALHFGRQKLNLHSADKVLDPNVRHATPGSADLCFLLEVSLATAQERLAAEGVKVITGPVERTGAQGPMRSIYFYDPDENVIELSELQ
jgi:catechol 2,3-dioxygenase-like lactoylglutathione lyase family enzyme